MNISPLDYYMQTTKEGRSDEVGVILFKPECPFIEISLFINYCQKNNITILLQKNITLSPLAVIGLYPKNFSFSKDDLYHGLGWKHKTVLYLTSAQSVCFFLQGDSMQQKLNDFKFSLRKKYNKISQPVEGMLEEDIMESVIKNHIHVVDNCELQNSLWLLFYGKL